MGKGHLN